MGVSSQRKTKVWTKLTKSGEVQTPSPLQPLPLRGPCSSWTPFSFRLYMYTCTTVQWKALLSEHMICIILGAHSHIRGLGLDDALEARQVSSSNYTCQVINDLNKSTVHGPICWGCQWVLPLQVSSTSKVEFAMQTFISVPVPLLFFHITSIVQTSQGMVGQVPARRAAGIILEMIKVCCVCRCGSNYTYCVAKFSHSDFRAVWID